MLLLTDIRKVNNEVICHGSQGGVNATEFDLAVDLGTLEPSKVSIEPNFAVNQAYAKLLRLIRERGADNLPETATVATH